MNPTPSNPQPAIRNPQSIRVLLVDDSQLALVLLQRMLASASDIEVVGTARNGKEALRVISQLKPDVICTDFYMPVMNGLEFTQEVMAHYPCPILVVSSAVESGNKDKVFPLLQAGAVDVFPKPINALELDPRTVQQFISRIRLLSGVPVFTRHPKRPPAAGVTEGARKGVIKASASSPQAEQAQPEPPESSPLPPRPQLAAHSIRLIAIGASTGGPQTLQKIFSALPADLAVPILCVQHISEGFLQGLVDWLSTQCKLKVQIARSGDTPLPGTIYFPQEKTHLEIDPRGYLLTSRKPPVDGHRPSVTATFRSVAAYYKKDAVGVLLTGMGRDGAEGLQAISQAGGVTIAQDEASCVVFGMPQQAIVLGAARYVLSPPEIAATLMQCVGEKR